MRVPQGGTSGAVLTHSLFQSGDHDKAHTSSFIACYYLLHLIKSLYIFKICSSWLNSFLSFFSFLLSFSSRVPQWDLTPSVGGDTSTELVIFLPGKLPFIHSLPMPFLLSIRKPTGFQLCWLVAHMVSHRPASLCGGDWAACSWCEWWDSRPFWEGAGGKAGV